jgi:hypothetical protein
MDEGLLTPLQTINDVAVNYQGYALENLTGNSMDL